MTGGHQHEETILRDACEYVEDIYPGALAALDALVARNRSNELWKATNVARAKGLAEALAHPLGQRRRPGSVEEIASEIAELLGGGEEPPA